MDNLTSEIVKQIELLPTSKKKAILELLKPENKSIAENGLKEQWEKELLKTSVWSKSDIDNITKSREYINQWNLTKL